MKILITKKPGIELIAQERQEQMTKHKRSSMDDVVFNDKQQLPTAAVLLIEGGSKIELNCPFNWSHDIWLKMARKSYEDRLIIAGALIAAEIDRLHYDEIRRR